ncbi:hypothetical protein J4730_19595 [Klebsiella pneumoniae]|uniref:Uncharacterized protein n=1 Tax=Klebsiella pneumoniae TaxID=573 RepID=A0A939ST28_KLEPN|nr:hypothetical protein [Klebsiella pneumoniae]
MKLIIGMTGPPGHRLGGIAAGAARYAGGGNPSGDVEMGQNHHRAGNAPTAREVAALADFSHSPADQPPPSHPVHFVPTA